MPSYYSNHGEALRAPAIGDGSSLQASACAHPQAIRIVRSYCGTVPAFVEWFT
jgi:hypothetical protein